MTTQTPEERHNREVEHYYSRNRAHYAEEAQAPDAELAIKEHGDAARFTDNAVQRRYHLDRIAFWQGHICRAGYDTLYEIDGASCSCGWAGPVRSYPEQSRADMTAHMAAVMCEIAHALGLHAGTEAEPGRDKEPEADCDSCEHCGRRSDLRIAGGTGRYALVADPVSGERYAALVVDHPAGERIVAAEGPVHPNDPVDDDALSGYIEMVPQGTADDEGARLDQALGSEPIVDVRSSEVVGRAADPTERGH